MNFQRGRHREEPEINFIPLIDLLLVILIFLMVTTTYSRYSELKINLPAAQGTAQAEKSNEIDVAVSPAGEMMVGEVKLPAGDRDGLVARLKDLAAGKHGAVVVINADAKASHQSVVGVMEAARLAGLTQLTFATQLPSDARP
ncbi:ExbD/TolR family protein [Pseudogulbenkiania subflava]|uniref:Biopolymer transport protein ExbD n=1 Tax=Pseudogulbenkiania subflava DSM 22618 TaxID=1123014 RepID=A0A1Y6BME1_9NEIS|nr:biopolymer transporter ExbD [Pseudogulbenkiania subflava]SMF19693.1 biopolymer transport protein ExbD [Pseudogulbenkiania subflava DSM 22618]